MTNRIPQLVELCKKYRIVRMYLFGSAATDKFNEETSDIDLLFSFSPELTIDEYTDNYFDIASIERTKQLIYGAT